MGFLLLWGAKQGLAHSAVNIYRVPNMNRNMLTLGVGPTPVFGIDGSGASSAGVKANTWVPYRTRLLTSHSSRSFTNPRVRGDVYVLMMYKYNCSGEAAR